jgi:hypothetical protein
MNSYLIEEQEPSVKAIGIILSNSNSTNTDTLLFNGVLNSFESIIDN